MVGAGEAGPVDWFEAGFTFGSYAAVTAVVSFRIYCATSQFILRMERDGWYADPPTRQTKNMTLINGEELVGPRKLAAGDVIALRNRKNPRLACPEPMHVRLEAC